MAQHDIHPFWESKHSFEDKHIAGLPWLKHTCILLIHTSKSANPLQPLQTLSVFIAYWICSKPVWKHLTQSPSFPLVIHLKLFYFTVFNKAVQTAVRQQPMPNTGHPSNKKEARVIFWDANLLTFVIVANKVNLFKHLYNLLYVLLLYYYINSRLWMLLKKRPIEIYEIIAPNWFTLYLTTVGFSILFGQRVLINCL